MEAHAHSRLSSHVHGGRYLECVIVSLAELSSRQACTNVAVHAYSRHSPNERGIRFSFLFAGRN
eukprot:6199315-Pleurochrysis_carterae.AAC.1